ncbi:hypothetical protein QJS10_CPB15g01690 [Acorus calamus]|uniref:Uncharacterized protein n=1 Tax=Acorus calamus TaxID=4465 RepID=A0AAV9D5I5_ACOCL|nr:hypothetical protein QJS10_CPB15g01690 [Acorus calamus]
MGTVGLIGGIAGAGAGVGLRRRGGGVGVLRGVAEGILIAGVDYSKLIEGYSQMTPAERVKAKMKHQLSRTAEKDTAKGMGAGWERFDFNKDAPLDDEEIEVAEDDALLVKNMGHSFHFSALETKREEDVKAAHDQAMFGGSTTLSGNSEKESIHEDVTQEEDAQPGKTLVSDKVLSIQQGSWRDRVRRLHDGSKV